MQHNESFNYLTIASVKTLHTMKQNTVQCTVSNKTHYTCAFLSLSCLALMSNLAKDPRIIHLDLAIIGGGAAGLWLLNRAQAEGYQCALFEHKALGSDQTLASQGMIHGGMKYTLGGALSSASESIAQMPDYWRTCLAGKGDVDLRQTQLLSDHFFLWSSATASSRLTTFLASKLVRGRVDTVPATQRPALLQHPAFRGSLYQLADLVLDVPSLLSNLAQPVSNRLCLIDWAQSRLVRTATGQVELQCNHIPLVIRARRFIFMAGKGNAELLAQLNLDSPAMQERPLQQVMVKHHLPYRFYGHCLGTETTPRLTISSHPTADGKLVWYLGGSLAEKGADQTPAEVIAAAQREIAELMPWVNLQNAEWASLPVVRAEHRQSRQSRPDDAFVGPAAGVDNLLVAWPTKLTLVPKLANQIIALLAQHPAKPEANTTIVESFRPYFPEPRLAPSPWEAAFPVAAPARAKVH
jgi:glycerol-3-phosphate dehydrogenase